MKIKQFTTWASLALALVLLAGASSTAFAQGRGRGGGGGGGGGMGRGGGSGGVSRGLGTASGRSGGRSDDGLGNASDRSRGRSDDGLERARERSRRDEERRVGDAPRTENELHRFNGIARKLDTTPEALRQQYMAARAANPDLKFGQFVAANVVADNLSGRHPGITAQAILSGLESGRSIGQTLRDLGLNEDEAKEAEKAAKREIKESQRRS